MPSDDRSACASAQSDKYSLFAWRNIGSLSTHRVPSKDTGQTGQMTRLIWVFAGRTGHFVCFVMRKQQLNIQCSPVFLWEFAFSKMMKTFSVPLNGMFSWTSLTFDCRYKCLCWGLMSQSTIFQSCRDGATASWVINQYFRGIKCLAQGHNTAAVGFEPPTSRSGVRHATTEPLRSQIQMYKNFNYIWHEDIYYYVFVTAQCWAILSTLCHCWNDKNFLLWSFMAKPTLFRFCGAQSQFQGML